MKDPRWLAVHRAISPLLQGSDCVLAPVGDWDPFPCEARFYGATIELGDATVLVLHKNRLAGLPKAALAVVVSGWQCLHAGEVFVVFARSPRRRLLARLRASSAHLRRVHAHLRSRDLKVLPSTIYHVHLPKTGGTAVWQALTRVFRSAVYYGDVDALLANPPEPGEYDLVGVHGPPSLIANSLRPGDVVAGLLREPTRRFFSSIVHGRRSSSDVTTLTPSQIAMRDLRVVDFLRTPAGRYEARLQLILLGTAHGTPSATVPGPVMLDAATAWLERDDTLFAPTEDSQAFLQALLARFNLSAPHLQRRNINPPEDYVRYRAEFAEALPTLDYLTLHDRRLFETVTRRFRARAP